MQTLTSAASITKRKQACSSCRHRKKRCDGERPTCSLCRKWGIQCEYAVPAANKSAEQSEIPSFPRPFFDAQAALPFNLVQMQDAMLNFLPFPDNNNNNIDSSSLAIDPTLEQATGYPTPSSEQPIDGTVNIDDSFSIDSGLPSDTVLIELINIFFDHSSTHFPCFHKQNLIRQVQNHQMQTASPIVLRAICITAARHHSDPEIRARRNDWFSTARLEYELSPRIPIQPVRTLQAAALLLTYAYTIGDFSFAWLVLGKAWRQMCALGFNRLDSEQGSASTFDLPEHHPDTLLETEELRRTLWLLFIIDRSHTWPTGWPHAIDERQFKVDIPIADEYFQAMSLHTIDSIQSPTPFTRHLNKLISSSHIPTESVNMFHYLVVAHVILGRITEQIHSPHNSPDSPEYAQECNDLDSCIVKFRLSIPRVATSALESSPEHREQAIWLNTSLNLMAMLLNYRCTKLGDQEESPEQFFRVIVAARNTAQMLKDASRISVDFLLSPHIASAFYIAACVLVVQWRMTGEDSFKEDADLFTLLFDRFNDVFEFIGLKFRLALDHDMERTMDSIHELREKGFKGLMSDCSKWRHVQQTVAQKGIYIT
ncbi:fungal-specific transcription factor domain-containing protein [Dendryphion nanum]|uniref:Fungal-specific transcription factor domain-containing protein n=1 Tax=Dendryphion nanum TaxID=256645 RepID=A0A9P9DS66_9PLEO|nr:fungal-specific transcription factor domain-containing protein [Dendryphion nanum]